MAKKKNIAKRKSKVGIWVFASIFVILVLVLFFSFTGKAKYDQTQVVEFAKCLTSSGTVMYGAYWCPHCADTKKMFGSAFKYVKYVECDPNGENEQSVLCIQKEIDKYDTWVFSDGSRFVSEPTFEDLAKGSGCIAPEAK